MKNVYYALGNKAGDRFFCGEYTIYFSKFCFEATLFETKEEAEAMRFENTQMVDIEELSELTFIYEFEIKVRRAE